MFEIGIVLTLLGLTLLLSFPKWKWYWKVLLGCALTVVAFKFHFIYLLTGNTFSPDISMWLQVVSGGAFAAFFITTGLALLNVLFWSISAVINNIITRQHVPFPRKKCAVGNGVCALLAIIISAAGCINGLQLPEVRETKLYFPNLPEAAEGLRIAVIADMHVSYTTSDDYMTEIARRTNAANPDVVVFTGDNADGNCHELSHKLEAIKDINSPPGIFGVTGNHEYYCGVEEYRKWLDFYKQNGIQMLFNTNVILPERYVAIGGISDETGARIGEDQNTDAVFEGVPDDFFRILLVHRPAPDGERGKVTADLQISGHTHGGMMPGLNLMVSLFNDGMYSGIYRKDGMTIALSNGSGIWGGFPLRLFCPTEIMLLELHAR